MKTHPVFANVYNTLTGPLERAVLAPRRAVLLKASAIRAPETRPGPVHVPAACTLDETGARHRIADWQRLARRAQLEASRQPGGAVELTYRDLPGVTRELRRLADAEARCCPFLTFTVTAEAGQPVTLRIAACPQADPGVAADLDQLASMFSQAG